MSDLLDLHRRALDGFGRRVAAVHSDQWHRATPCEDWDVRALVDHLTVEQLWAPLLLDGATVAEVGDRFEGDQLGEDPAGAWDLAARAAVEAFARPGALERQVMLSYGERDAAGYCWEMTTDAVVHTWDLARAVGGDEVLDEELVAMVHERTAPQVDSLAGSGLFDPPVAVPDDADLQTRMLALFGRRA
jgi:uncharacterized protein (TIGR03086 family)